MGSEPGGVHVCPERFAGWLSTPLRRLVHRPEKILAGMVKEGDVAADLGCGPGFFTMAMARMVGETGSVLAIDLQQGMLERVRRAAAKEGLEARIRLHQCSATEIGIGEPVADFALAFYMVHEVPDVAAFLRQVRAMLKPGGRFLLVEPKVHVSKARFARTVEMAREAGMEQVDEPNIVFSQTSLLVVR